MIPLQKVLFSANAYPMWQNTASYGMKMSALMQITVIFLGKWGKQFITNQEANFLQQIHK